jgi:pimeloyl-ACP methyl ester carboxylesterase
VLGADEVELVAAEDAVIQYPFAIGSVNTRVLEAGQGESAVTFIHGVGARADRWRGSMAAMARAGHHAFALDLPGHGFAGKGDGFDYGIPGYARLVGEFLDAMDVRRSVLVGTSMGGHIAGRVAADHPERVAGLVLVGTLGIVPMGPDHRLALSRSLADTGRSGIEAKLRRLIHDDAVLVDDAWITEEWRINNSPGAKRSFAILSEYFADHVDDDVVGARLQEVAPGMPTMLVWGEKDVMVPIDVLRRCQAVLPNAETLIVAGTSHAPYRERPEIFAAALTRFIAGLSLPSPARGSSAP